MTYAHTRYCVNCKHFIARKYECEMHHTTSYVSGEIIYTSAHLLRQTKEHCGPDGQWFEPITEAADLDDLSTIPFGK
jgi:hypothetical protein